MRYEEIVNFHGHECPGLAMGYRMALAGLDALTAHRAEDEELVAIVENDACGEGVMISRTRQLDQNPVCIPCFEKKHGADAVRE